MKTFSRRISLLMVMILTLATTMTIIAQETPQPAYVEGAFRAVQSAMQRNDAPVNWSFQQAATTTNSGLSCPSATNVVELNVEIVPWRVVVQLADGADYIVYTSTDGTLANLCDADFGEQANTTIDVSPTGCIANVVNPTALQRLPLDIAASVGDLTAEDVGAVIGRSDDALWLHLAVNGQKGWAKLENLATSNAFVSDEDFCAELPQTGIASPQYDPAIACYISPLTSYANVRSLPSVDGDLVTQIYENSAYQARGINSIGDWVLLDVGWVFSAIVVQEGACDSLVSVPDDSYLTQAGATPMPTNTPEATPIPPTPTPLPVTSAPAQPTVAPVENVDLPSIALTAPTAGLVIAPDGALYYASEATVYLADFVNQAGTPYIQTETPISRISLANDTTIAVALQDGTVQLWDITGDAPNQVRVIANAFDPQYNTTVGFIPDLSFYLSAGCATNEAPDVCTQGTINLHDATSAQVLRVQPAHPEVPRLVQFIGEGETAGTQIASVGYDGVQIWDTVTGAFVSGFATGIADSANFFDMQVLASGDVIWAYRFPDATNLFVARINIDQPSAPAWNADGGELGAVSLAVSADGSRVVLGRDNGLLTVWDATTGESIVTTQIPMPLVDVALSADGRILLISNATNVFAVQVP
jgi:hypothetical protein